MPAGLFRKLWHGQGASAEATAPEPPMPFLGALRDKATNHSSLDEKTNKPPTTVQARRRPSQCPRRQKDLQRRGKHGGASVQAMWSRGL